MSSEFGDRTLCEDDVLYIFKQKRHNGKCKRKGYFLNRVEFLSTIAKLTSLNYDLAFKFKNWAFTHVYDEELALLELDDEMQKPLKNLLNELDDLLSEISKLREELVNFKIDK